MNFCFHVDVSHTDWTTHSCTKVRGVNKGRESVDSGGTGKAAAASLVCQHVSCVCVSRQVMWTWHQIVTSSPRARWGSPHVEPLDITVSSVNWPLTPGHFTLRVNDVFTPLHDKQHTPRVHILTKEMCLCSSCPSRKIQRGCKMTSKDIYFYIKSKHIFLYLGGYFWFITTWVLCL